MKRIKRAVFELFRDEILNFVGHNKYVTEHIRVEKEIRMTEIKSEIILDNKNGHQLPPQMVYEQALERARVRLFNEVVKYVQVDTRSIVEEYPSEGRIIKLSLYVGQKQ